MENFKQKILNYKKLEEEIFEAFGYSDGYGEIDVQLDTIWNKGNYNIWWKDENGEIYNNEIRHEFKHYENFVLFYVDNDNGENYYQIFDLDLMTLNLNEDE